MLKVLVQRIHLVRTNIYSGPTGSISEVSHASIPVSFWEPSPRAVPTTSYTNRNALPLACICPLTVWKPADIGLADPNCAHNHTGVPHCLSAPPHRPQIQSLLRQTHVLVTARDLAKAGQVQGPPQQLRVCSGPVPMGDGGKKEQGLTSSEACNLAGKPARWAGDHNRI